MTERKDRHFKSRIEDFTQNAKSVGNTVAQSVKATGDVTVDTAKSARETATRGVNSAGDAIIQGTEAARETVTESTRSAGDVITQAAKAVGSATAHGMKTTGDSVRVVRPGIPWKSVTPEQMRRSIAASIESSKSLSRSAKRRLVAQIGQAFGSVSQDGLIGQTQAFIIIQGILASDQISHDVSGWIQSFVEGLTPINVDATVTGYTGTVGSGVYLSESSDYAEAIDTVYIDTVASESYTLVNLEISRSWLNDLASYNILGLIAGSIGILAVALNWNNDDVEEFPSLVGSIGLSAAVTGNPLMLITTVVALARAFHVARKSGDWKEFSDGLAKGGICTGAVLLTTSLMSGPMVVVLLSGICVGILAHQATKNVSFVEIGQFMVHEIRKAQPMLDSAVASAKDVLPNST